MPRTILVADDNRSFTDLLRATLEEAGYEVVTASTGLAAVECMRRHDVVKGAQNSVSCGEVVIVDEAAEPVAVVDGGGW